MQLPRQNDVFAREYVIQDELGAGGFAVVYRARWKGEVVAVKVLRPQQGAYSFEVVARFNREAGILAALQHPNVPRVFDHGRTDEGLLYIVSEFIAGDDLRSLTQMGPVGEELTEHVLREVLKALTETHAKGLLHRDIKPDNIRLTPVPGARPKVTLLDFGIARYADSEQGGRLTATGMLVGTPRYMSPEQLRSGKLSPASDLYSLAMVGVEMLGGSGALHGGSLPEQLGRVAGAASIDVKTTHRPLQNLLLRSLAVDAAARPQSAGEALAMLDGRGEERPGAQTSIRRTRGPLILAALVLFGVISVVFWQSDDPDPAPPVTYERENPLSARELAPEPAPEPIVDMGSADAAALAPETPLPKLAPDGRCDAMPALEPGLARWGVDSHPEDPKSKIPVLTYIPTRYDPRREHPVVMLFHGALPDNAAKLFEKSGFQTVADAHHVVVVAIDDSRFLGQAWVSSRRVAIKNAFTSVDERVCVDHERIFAVGQGRGSRAAMFTPCLFGARAVATNGWRSDVEEDGRAYSYCPERVPYLHILGLRDPNMTGGGGCVFPSAPVPLAAHHHGWKELQGCSGPDRAWAVDARCRTWTCRDDYVSCEFDAGRTWGAPLGCKVGGPPTPGLADLIWRFFDSVD